MNNKKELGPLMNKAQCDSLFDRHAVFMGGCDVLPEYAAIEIYGEWLAGWLDSVCVYKGHMEAGRDYNYTSDFQVRYYYRAGFYKIASKCQGEMLAAAQRRSPAASVIETVRAERRKRIAEKDREGFND